MLAHLVSGRYVKAGPGEPYVSGTPAKAGVLAWLVAVFSGRKRSA